MAAIKKHTCSCHGNAVLEFTLIVPLLLTLIFGTAEISNMVGRTTSINHLTRESANVASRQLGIRGSAAWATSLNADLVTVIDTAAPVVNRTGTGPTGPSQFKLIYSQVEWNPALPICDYNLDNTLPLSCLGTIANGQPDYYRIRRSNTGWAGSITWQYGSLAGSSQIGNDGECACRRIGQVKQLSTQGLTLHAIELYYDYRPSRITSFDYLLGGWISATLYRRSFFLDRT